MEWERLLLLIPPLFVYTRVFVRAYFTLWTALTLSVTMSHNIALGQNENENDGNGVDFSPIPFPI